MTTTTAPAKAKKLKKAPEYVIEESRFGLYTSVTLDGVRMVTGMTETGVRFCTDHIHIPVMMGTFNGWTSEARSSVVGGKL